MKYNVTEYDNDDSIVFWIEGSDLSGGIAEVFTKPDADYIARMLELRDNIDDPSKFRPMNDQVFVKPVQRNKSGSLIIPDKRNSELWSGMVIAAGPGKKIPGTDDRIPMQVKAGDYVYFGWNNSLVEINFEQYFVMHESEILGVME